MILCLKVLKYFLFINNGNFLKSTIPSTVFNIFIY